LPAPPALEPEQARFRLFDSITTFLKNAAKARPLALVLDDLHWSDKPSLLLLQFLARELRAGRLLVLGTYRDVELRRQHPLAQTLGELNREALSQRILLRGLTAQDVRRFVEITAGITPPPALVEAVFKETEGNPFFVNEIVRLLVTDGRLEHPEAVKQWSVTIPQSVREVVGRRLDHLSDACNKVLTIGAVIGREFGLRVLEKVILRQAQDERLSGDRLLEALEEAVAARVITEVPRPADQYSFSHALIRETLYEELTTTRRVRLHRGIGEVLEELDPEANLPQLAYHFAEAAPGGDVEKAVDYARKAGERAVELLAYEEAVGHYERALQALELKDAPDEAQRCELLVALGEAQIRASDPRKAMATCEQAAGIARQMGFPELLARAALGFEWARFAAGGGVTFGEEFRLGVRLVEEALHSLPGDDSTIRARLLGRLAMALWTDLSRRAPLSEQAVEMARRLGHPATLAETLAERHFAVWGPENLEDRLAAAAEIIELGETTGDKDAILDGRSFLTIDLLELGDVQAADREIEVCAQLAEELRLPGSMYIITVRLAMRAQMDGRFEEAERLAQQALQVGQRTLAENALPFRSAQMFSLYWDQGRLEQLEMPIKTYVQQFPAIVTWRCVLALVFREMGREKEARAEFEDIAKDDFAGLPQNVLWLIGIAIIAEVCAFLCDAARATVLYDLLLPYANRNVVAAPGMSCVGSASRYLGLLATTMSRWDEAAQHFEDAMEMNLKMGARPFLARCQQEYAGMLLARDKAGDPSASLRAGREKALQLLNQALEIAQELGMKMVVERALKLKLEAQGISLSDLGTSIDTVAREVLADQPDLKPHAAPDGTVTIMFSDIEGSTEMTERLGDQRWMDLLREHNAIVREQVKTHGGFEVKSEGDGFMVAFQSARRALECAIATQRAFASEQGVGARLRDDGTERQDVADDDRVIDSATGSEASLLQGSTTEIRVRIGLHSGEVIKEGEDFFGRNVIMAARVASQAQGGEILVSGVLKALVAGSDVPWGEKRTGGLKGLSGEHEIWPVAWESQGPKAVTR